MKRIISFSTKYLVHHKYRSLLIICSLTLLLFLPYSFGSLVSLSQNKLRARALSTPLLIGANNSTTDLVINSLYFKDKEIVPLKTGFIHTLDQLQLGQAIPLNTAHSARRFRIVGTDLDYFEFRDLRLSQGQRFGFIGECVLGSKVASSLDLKVGDKINSSPQSYFDFADYYPIEMNITGILQSTNTPDDEAIFTDMKTSWIISGIGHGHEDAARISDETIVLKQDSSNRVLGAKLKIQETITSEDLDQFHFHGNMEDYPVSAFIFVPNDDKSAALLRGKFEAGELPHQVNVPEKAVNDILEGIFKLEAIFKVFWILVSIACLMILIVVGWLSIQARQQEFNMLLTIGVSKGTIVRIVVFEYLILIGLSLLLAMCLSWWSSLYVDEFLNYIILK